MILMSFFNGLIVAREQAYVSQSIVIPAPPVPTVTPSTGGTYGAPARMALPKRKWLLIKRFLEEESLE